MPEPLNKATSVCRYLRIHPRDIAVFRFLLEAYGHVGYFSVLEKQQALLKFVYSNDMSILAERTLSEIAETLPIEDVSSPFF